MTTYTIGPSGSGADYLIDSYPTGTNHQTTINSVLSTAGSASGNIVYLKGPCTYDIQSSVEVPNGIELTGDSTAILRIHNGMSWAAQVPVIKQSNSIASNITIHGFQIDCNRFNQVGDQGDGLYNGINLAGASSSHGTNVSVHHMTIYDSLGDGIQIKYIDNATAYENNISVMGHEGIYFIGLTGGDIYNNTIEQKDNSAIRLDNCKNVNIHDNATSKYDETGHATVADGNGAIQIGNRPASYNMLQQTDNIKIYDNTITQGAGSGILMMDACGSSGTTAQNVHIWNNTFVGCGWMRNIKYNAAISIWNWGNGLVIEYNSISGSYNAGFLVYSAIASGCTIQLNNNNITGTLATLATDPTRQLSVTGYGILNVVPSKMTVYAENNYLANNLAGNYYQVTPISEATVANGDYDSGGTSEGGTTPASRYIPPIRIIQEELADYYIDGRTGYINGVPFRWREKKTDITKSIGEHKAPGVIGWNLTDFDFKGAELTLDCFALSMDELYEVISAFYDTSRGRSTLELGTPYTNKQVSGIAANHSSSLRLNADIPDRSHPYSLLFMLDKPYLESTTKKVRGRYVTGSMEWSSDDTYAGNLLKNASFESWAKSSTMTWEIGTSLYDNEWRGVRWSKELAQFCAISRGSGDTTGTRIITSSDGDTWAVPTGYTLANASNYNNRWAGLTWGSCIGLSSGEPLGGRWIAVSISGTNNRSIYSDDGINWYAGGTTNSNNWVSICYIRDDAESVYRYVAVSYGASETSRVMYTDDGGVTWSAVASADDSYQWLSVAYSDPLKIVVAVAYAKDGGGDTKTMWSDDYGETWTLGTSPATTQQWSSVTWADHISKFVACALDGDNNQIMTSPDGKTWTAQTTPYAGSTVTPGAGTVVSTNTYQTPTGYVYTTKSLTYTEYACTDASSSTDPSNGILVIEAPGTGHKWIIDQVFCDLRTGGSCCNAWFKITATTATIAETTLAEWDTNSTSYVPFTQNTAFEGVNDEAITLTVYMKTENDDIKAIATDIGYVLTEWDGAGGSTVSYTVNQWRAIASASDIGLIVCTAQTGTGNRAMMSTDGDTWTLCTTPADNNWYSCCYSPELNKFVSVAGSGTGNRLMTASTYGAVTTPSSWIIEGTGQSRSDAIAHDGLYALQITADGTADVGITKQYVIFDPGVSYVLSAWGSATGVTSGELSVEIYSGNSIITQLTWDEDCDYTQLQDTVRFDTAPTDAYIKIHAINSANTGAIFYCDDVLLERASDFEVATTGSDLTTTGHVDIIPDVEVKAITSSSSSNVSKGDTKTVVDGDVHSRTSTSYVVDYTATLPALANGKYYRFDKFSCELGTANVSGVTGYLKITVTAASLNSGAETKVVEWSSTTRLPSRAAKSINTEIYSATNETVVIKVYLKTTNTSAKVSASDISYTYTEMIPSVTSSAIGIYNIADSLTIMSCCNELKPGCSVAINADGTGNYKYSENFADGQYEYAVTDSAYTTYYDDEKMLLLENTNGYITYCFDTKYPITGVPYIVINTMSGAPLLYIAEDNAGSPGTWYALDGNSNTEVTNTQVYRLLNSGTSCVLNGLTKFHLKLVAGGTDMLRINSIFMYCDLVTLDAERPKIFKGQSNTFGATVTTTASAIVTLKYRDADLLV